MVNLRKLIDEIVDCTRRSQNQYRDIFGCRIQGGGQAAYMRFPVFDSPQQNRILCREGLLPRFNQSANFPYLSVF